MTWIIMLPPTTHSHIPFSWTDKEIEMKGNSFHPTDEKKMTPNSIRVTFGLPKVGFLPPKGGSHSSATIAPYFRKLIGKMHLWGGVHRKTCHELFISGPVMMTCRRGEGVTRSFVGELRFNRNTFCWNCQIFKDRK